MNQTTTQALLELFAEIQTVFEEYPALDGKNAQRSLGRCYRAYKTCRKVLEEEAK